MPAFKYQHGDRPLEGYTIEHGVGRGGFGEVYYAVSDSGRHLAIKAVQNYEDIELRGIGHCMNLKSPYLVTIFDVKHNDAGQPFVLMEFVSGSSLRQLLDVAPEGLGKAKAAFFLREMAKGLTYLHDCGVVHRDLKPHNVFFEDGIVKIGDYSLSKIITTSHRSGHTMTVGTVHYMAPEISMGRYDSSVDIYALGIILYEMLTGQPPFTGESVGEVLMKHMASEPDVSGIEEPFASVIKKALAKDPAHRFRSAQDMVEAVFGAEHVQNSVTAFNPNSLSVVAEKVASKVAGRGGTAAATQAYLSTSKVDATRETSLPAKSEESPRFAYYAGRATAKVTSNIGLAKAVPSVPPAAIHDPLMHKQRVMLAAVTAISFSMGLGILRGAPRDISTGILAFMIIAFMSMAVAMVRKRLVPKLANESSFVHRLAFGGMSCLAAMPAMIIVSAAPLAPDRLRQVVIAAMLVMFVLDWRSVTSPVREQRLSLSTTLFAAILGAIAAAICGGDPVFAAGIMAGIVLTSQVGSAFDSEASKKVAEDEHRLQSAKMAVAVPEKEPRVSPVADAAALAVDADVPPVTPVAPKVSPKLRLVALLLSIVPFVLPFPVAGLQRFYVGKIGTGILWLLTGGLFYVGQIIDLVLVAVGAFRDAEDQPLVAWTNPDDVSDSAVRKLHAQPVNQYSTVPAETVVGGLSRFLLTTVGGLVLAGALVLGLGMSVNVPAAIAGGMLDVFESGIAAEIENAVGMSDWPRLAVELGMILTAVLGICSVLMLLVARRGAGVAHMLRLIVGSGGLFGALIPVAIGFDRVPWNQIAESLKQQRIGPAVDSLVNTSDLIPCMVIASILTVCSVFVLAWPARKPAVTVSQVQPVREVVRQ